MVISAIPNAKAIPTMPNCPPPNTAAPSPVSTSTNVPNISAAYFIAILLGFNLDPSTANDCVAYYGRRDAGPFYMPLQFLPPFLSLVKIDAQTEFRRHAAGPAPIQVAKREVHGTKDIYSASHHCLYSASCGERGFKNNLL